MILTTFDRVTELHGALFDRNLGQGLDAIVEMKIKEIIERQTQTILQWESPKYLSKAQQLGIAQSPTQALRDSTISK